VNSPSAQVRGPVTSRAGAPGLRAWVAGKPRIRMFQTLVRREFWEHRSLWLAPLGVSALLLICALLTHGALKIDATDSTEWLDPQIKTIVFALAQWALTIPHYLVMILLLSFYLLDCLYAERKDRSILFWKSLPVTDGATVASKIFVACVVLPLGTFALALVTDVLFAAIWNVRAFVGHAPELVAWDTTAFLKTQALMFLGLIISVLWYSPFLGCFLLASAALRRNVVMWVTVVPLLAVILERIAFGTHWLSALIDYRGDGIWHYLHLEGIFATAITNVGGSAEIVSVPRVFDLVRIGPAFTNIDLWLGVLFAAACAWGAARIRRYRDET
jgi:ABC-2 type transport system permease protein